MYDHVRVFPSSAWEGLQCRDYIAIEMLKALVIRGETGINNKILTEYAVKEAYDLADALIEQSNK